MLRPLPRTPSRLNRTEMSMRDKIWQINWSLIAVLTAMPPTVVCATSLAMAPCSRQPAPLS